MDITTNPCLITSADANDTVLTIKCKIPPGGPKERTAFITVISGTLKFNVGASADDANCPSYVANDKVEPVSFEVSNNGKTTLHFKADAAARTFRIGIA